MCNAARSALLALALVTVPAMPGRSAAQSAAPYTSAPDDTTGAARERRRAIFHRRDLVLTGGAALAIAAAPLMDEGVSAELLEPDLQANRDWRQASVVGNAIGGVGPIALSTSLYATGRLAGRPGLARLGATMTRGVLLSGSVTLLLKGLSGRERPFASPGRPDILRPGHGFAQARYASFPSGHTSAAFACATVLATSEDLSPRVRHIVGPVAFGAATLVGMSRLYGDQHWASDVTVGAVLGVISGDVATSGRLPTMRMVGRALRHTMLVPGPHGLEVGWSR